MTPEERRNSALAALELYARQYTGGAIAYGDRLRSLYEGSTYLGRQKDGRYAWRFGHEHDARDFVADALRICASEPHVIDADITWHPHTRAGTTIVLLRLEDPPPCGHSRCSQNFIDTGDRECIQPRFYNDGEVSRAVRS